MAQRAAQLAEQGQVDASSLAHLPEALAQRIAEQPVVFIDELAELLGTSVRTLKRQLRAGTFFIEEAPKVDYRHRWSRARVYLAIADTTLSSHRQTLVGPRAVAPRKTSGEAARERDGR
jgi:hypothetical protein